MKNQDAVSRNGGPMDNENAWLTRPFDPEAPAPGRKTGERLPYVGDPTVQPITGLPDDCWEYVNRWGTYEVQSTQDTNNPYPSIAQGYPTGPVDNAADPWGLTDRDILWNP